MTVPRLRVGKISSRAPVYPSEPGYVASINRQLKELEGLVVDIIEQTEDVTPDILLEAWEPTFKKSQYYTPKDTHDLVKSGYLEVRSKGKKPTVEMGYGKGGKPDYAVYVHEILSYHHEHPTSAKFLQRAVMEDLEGLWMRLQSAYRAFFHA